MKFTFDKQLNIAYLKIRKGRVARTVKIRKGILLDVDNKGDVLGIEILSTQPKRRTNKRAA